MPDAEQVAPTDENPTELAEKVQAVEKALEGIPQLEDGPPTEEPKKEAPEQEPSEPAPTPQQILQRKQMECAQEIQLVLQQRGFSIETWCRSRSAEGGMLIIESGWGLVPAR